MRPLRSNRFTSISHSCHDRSCTTSLDTGVQASHGVEQRRFFHRLGTSWRKLRRVVAEVVALQLSLGRLGVGVLLGTLAGRGSYFTG